jgi:hypothetical protein
MTNLTVAFRNFAIVPRTGITGIIKQYLIRKDFHSLTGKIPKKKIPKKQD